MHILLDHIPPASHSYVESLLYQYSFVFKLKNKRSTKLGDFRNDKTNRQYIISVNRDLNPYQFLITFLHELAHLVIADSDYKVRKAHGVEWKDAFRSLVQPILREDIIPQPLNRALIRHMKNPKASAGSDPQLWSAFKSLDSNPNVLILDNLPDGKEFIFRKKKFRKVKKRRTRVLSMDLNSKRLYLIPAIAEVDVV